MAVISALNLNKNYMMLQIHIVFILAHFYLFQLLKTTNQDFDAVLIEPQIKPVPHAM